MMQPVAVSPKKDPKCRQVAALQIGGSSYKIVVDRSFAQRCPMLRTTSSFLTLAILIGIANAGEPQPRLPRDNLLVYRGLDGKAAPVKTVADWTKRRAEIVRGMETVMGKLPGDAKRCALDMKVEEETDRSEERRDQ